MTQDAFEFPDMDELARQMQDAMSEAQKALDDLPAQMGEMNELMGSLSSLMGEMPAQMGELNAALAGFQQAHEENVASSAGEPDWSLQATIRVGTKLHVVVNATFDLAQIEQAWHSTQSAGFESLVAGVLANSGTEVEAGLMGQITGQLKKGRSIAVVEKIEVLACHLQGAPGDAADKLTLSPEANIPLLMDAGGLGFEFAPLLTIRNRWEQADIPTFSPLGEDLVVPLAHFEAGEPFELAFEPAGQEEEMAVVLRFRPLN